MARDLSILIPARNEMFLARTIEDILEHKEADTEVIVGLDGAWAEPVIQDHPDVVVLHYPVSIGQRAMTNQCARLSTAKYLMKVDAHCSFGQGFDRIMLEDMQDNWTMACTMKNLHAFDWLCKDCGWRQYQGRTPDACAACGGHNVERDMVWEPRRGVASNYYRFDKDLHFQYWKDLGNRGDNRNLDLVESMSLQGSMFLLTCDKYWELDICDEGHGSWGQQGTEVACKTWLSGGRVVVTKKTWYAHLFRTQGGDFGFPYPNPGIEQARQYSRELWLHNKWDKALYPLSWLIEKFAPVPDWNNRTKGIIYYNDGRYDADVVARCYNQLLAAAGSIPIVSVSTSACAPISPTGTMIVDDTDQIVCGFKQILAGLAELSSDDVFICEPDVLYHDSHFRFTPPTADRYYFNTNCWQLRCIDGFAVRYDTYRVSQLCADRLLLLKHYQERVKRCDEIGYSHRMGVVPGATKRSERVDNVKPGTWQSAEPNVILKSGLATKGSRWSPSEFRDKKYCTNWQEGTDIPYWGVIDTQQHGANE